MGSILLLMHVLGILWSSLTSRCVPLSWHTSTLHGVPWMRTGSSTPSRLLLVHHVLLLLLLLHVELWLLIVLHLGSLSSTRRGNRWRLTRRTLGQGNLSSLSNQPCSRSLWHCRASTLHVPWVLLLYWRATLSAILIPHLIFSSHLIVTLGLGTRLSRSSNRIPATYLSVH